MPIYEYKCKDHGVFERLRSMNDCKLPATCPECAVDSPRILSAPRLSQVSHATRVAHDRNEQSRHEPKHSRTSCGHEHHHKSPPAQAGQQGRPQVYNGPRPWVMEHA